MERKNRSIPEIIVEGAKKHPLRNLVVISASSVVEGVAVYKGFIEGEINQALGLCMVTSLLLAMYFYDSYKSGREDDSK